MVEKISERALDEALVEIEDLGDDAVIGLFLDSIKHSTRGIIR